MEIDPIQTLEQSSNQGIKGSWATPTVNDTIVPTITESCVQHGPTEGAGANAQYKTTS